MVKKAKTLGISALLALVACSDHAGNRSSIIGPDYGRPLANVVAAAASIEDVTLTIKDETCTSEQISFEPGSKVCAVAQFNLLESADPIHVQFRWHDPDGVIRRINMTSYEDETGARTFKDDLIAPIVGLGTWTVYLCESSDDSGSACPEGTERASQTFTVGVTSTDVTPPIITVSATAAPVEQEGYFNAADLAKAGGKIVVTVSADDDSGVSDLVCTDELNGDPAFPVTVHEQTGSKPRTGKVYLTYDGTHIVTCEGTDGASPANRGAAEGSDNTVTVKIDVTPPSVEVDESLHSCSIPGNAEWCRGVQQAGFRAWDATSGLRGEAFFTRETGTNGAKVLIESGRVADLAGNEAPSVHAGPFMIDSVNPEIACPVPGPTFFLNDVRAEVTASVSDGTSGPASTLLSAVANTETVGSRSVEFEGYDVAGNRASKSCGYAVAYRFEGLFAPVNKPPMVNGSKAGQAIPLKWRLTDAGGNPVTTLGAANVKVGALTCAADATEDEIEEYAAGSSGLQNLGEGYYQFNWKSAASLAGSCVTVSLELGEGTARAVLALFYFKN